MSSYKIWYKKNISIKKNPNLNVILSATVAKNLDAKININFKQNIYNFISFASLSLIKNKKEIIFLNKN